MIDPQRHLSVFSPEKFGSVRVDVIGAGATGSRMALSLAKLGIVNIHVWDGDVVEGHNIANQSYDIAHIGQMKVDALAEVISDVTGINITGHREYVDGSQSLGEVVFLVTDTMASRREIWENGIKLHLRTKLMIETRMGVDNGRIYTINPSKVSHIKEWESTLYEDDEAEVSACGASVSVGPTAETISGLAVWQFIRWFGIQNGEDDELENEIIFSIRPTGFITRRF